MALIKYAALAQELAGSIGGATFARVHSAKIVRGWRRPPYSATAAQREQRQLHAIASNNWFTLLNAAQRLGWETYALTCPFINTLGQTYYLVGFNLYVRNAVIYRVFVGLDLIEAPPFDGFPNPVGLDFNLIHATGVLTINAWDPAPDGGGTLYFHIHNYSRITRNQLPPTLNVRLTVPGIATPPAWLHDYPIPLPLTAGRIHAGIVWYYRDEYTRISKRQTALVPSE